MKKKNVLKRCLFLSFFMLAIMMVILLMLRYEVEGEKVLPYKLSKILMISTVEGKKEEDNENLWNINLNQVNDFYFYIDPMKKDEDKKIKTITFDNFIVTQNPQVGQCKIYRPTGELDKLYMYSEQDYLKDKIIYTGDKIDDLKSLQIANNGGVAGFRFSVENLGKYISNEDTEIVYNGSLLNKIGVAKEQVETNISFDISIQTNDNITYKGNIAVKTPAGDLLSKESSNLEITDFDNVVFKRVKTN